MYKKVAIATLIIAPIIVDLASRAGPGEAPQALESNAGAAPASTPPAPVATATPPRAATRSGEPVPTMDTTPALDTNPQLALTSAAPPPPPAPAPQTPTLGQTQPAPAQAPFEPAPIAAGVR